MRPDGALGSDDATLGLVHCLQMHAQRAPSSRSPARKASVTEYTNFPCKKIRSDADGNAFAELVTEYDKSGIQQGASSLETLTWYPAGSE